MRWSELTLMAGITYAFRAVGLFASRTLLPGSLQALAELLPAALLAGLIAVQVVGDGAGFTIDARLVGLVAACLGAWRRWPLAVIILIAVAATALTRLLGASL